MTKENEATPSSLTTLPNDSEPEAARQTPPPHENPAGAAAKEPTATAEGEPEPATTSATPELGDRVNSLVKAILERLVPETQRISATLAEVETRVGATEARAAQIGDYAQRWTDELIAEERQRTARAFDDILRQLVYPMHDQLFTKMCAMEAGAAEPDPLVMSLLQNLEGCLERLDVRVLRPQPGEPFEITYMESIEAAPARFFRKPDTVARVHRCGFVLEHDDKQASVMRKSCVDVYRKV